MEHSDGQNDNTKFSNFLKDSMIIKKSYEAIEMSQNVNSLNINIEYVHIAHE